MKRPRSIGDNRPLSPREVRKIKTMTVAGDTQQVIACSLDRSVGVVQKYQRKLGLSRWRTVTSEVEKEIVALLRQGVGHYRVAKLLRVPQPRVQAIMRAHKIVHPTGADIGAKKRGKIVQAIIAKEDHLYRLAKRFGVTRQTVSRYAHRIHGVDRFAGWVGIAPLTSFVDSEASTRKGLEKFVGDTVRQRVSMPDINKTFVALVDNHIRTWHNGVLPPDRAALASEILEAYVSGPQPYPGWTYSLEDWLQVRARVRAEAAGAIRAAIDALASSQSTWTN